MRLAEWGKDLVDLFLPAGFVACRSWIPGGREAPLVCAVCRSRLREAPWPRCPRCHHPRATGRAEAARCPECAAWPDALNAARHVCVLGRPSEDLVHALKYEGWSELAGFMGDAMAGVACRALSPGAGRLVVVPVPTTEERVRRRGYNQAELLARRVARARAAPLLSGLRRVGAGRSQTHLSPRDRAENVRGVFRPARGHGADVSGADVLLVDDVLTTGATASEAATVLAGMGAATVTLVTYARALATAPGGAH